MKIVRLSDSDPEKFGSKRAYRRDDDTKARTRQLNLFSTGRMLTLHAMSPFQEALLVDERGDKNAAKDLYLQAIQVGDQVADAYCNLGILESQENHTAAAIDHLTTCLKHNPRHPEAHFNLANLYSDAGNLELGKFHYEVCIEIEPDFSNSYLNLGLTLAAACRYDEAIEILHEYCRMVPSHEHHSANELVHKLQAIMQCK